MFTSLTDEAIFLWKTDANNQRPQMIESPALMEAALWKATYIENTNHISHCTEDGECPNAMIRRFGCNHPYSDDGNTIESLVWGTDTMKVAYDALISSPLHVNHIRGEIPFFKEQVYYGVSNVGVTTVFLSVSTCEDTTRDSIIGVQITDTIKLIR